MTRRVPEHWINQCLCQPKQIGSFHLLSLPREAACWFNSKGQVTLGHRAHWEIQFKPEKKLLGWRRSNSLAACCGSTSSGKAVKSFSQILSISTSHSWCKAKYLNLFKKSNRKVVCKVFHRKLKGNEREKLDGEPLCKPPCFRSDRWGLLLTKYIWQSNCKSKLHLPIYPVRLFISIASITVLCSVQHKPSQIYSQLLHLHHYYHFIQLPWQNTSSLQHYFVRATPFSRAGTALKQSVEICEGLAIQD